jgi:hypothetical protein
MSDEDDRTQDFYNAISDEESSRLKVRTPIKPKQDDKPKTEKISEYKEEVKNGVRLDETKQEKRYEKPAMIHDTEDISKAVISPGDPTKSIASQRKVVKNQNKETEKLPASINNELITAPPRQRPSNNITRNDEYNQSSMDNNKIPELKKNNLETEQDIIKAPADIPSPPPRRSQLAKPSFALKK